uniref:tRNA wybutosine-synthesizing protein 1 homolog n=1 Tax=Anoplopoma fimbria TaxID=229290 RepID=C3KGV1_ANOFI|nr:tRNA wybutosine-synthesizing protein 1 homolog [Anoplopoma fimbria]
MLTFFVVITLWISRVSASDTKVSQNAHSPSESYLQSIWHNRLYLYSAAALVFGVWFSLKVALKKKKFSKDSEAGKSNEGSDRDTVFHVSGVKIFYGSQTGTAKGFAEELSEEVKMLGIPAEVIDIKDYDPDDQLADEVSSPV